MGHNGRYGIYIDGPISGLDGALAYNNANTGIYVNGAVGSVTDSLAHHNRNWGFYLASPGNSLIQRNESYANDDGMYVSNASGTALVGGTDLSAGNGNRVHENAGDGLSVAGSGVVAAGNTIWGQLGINAYGMRISSGALGEANLISANSNGLYVNNATALANRVYHNSSTGIRSSQGMILSNVIYSNKVGIEVEGSDTLRNNLVYANTDMGVCLQGNYIYGGGGQFYNNTVCQAVRSEFTPECHHEESNRRARPRLRRRGGRRPWRRRLAAVARSQSRQPVHRDGPLPHVARGGAEGALEVSGGRGLRRRRHQGRPALHQRLRRREEGARGPRAVDGRRQGSLALELRCRHSPQTTGSRGQSPR